MSHLENNTKYKRLLGVILLQVISILLFYKCTTYNLSNNSKYRNWFPVKDEHIVSDSSITKHSLNYSEIDTIDSDQKLFYINPDQIRQIIDSTNQSLLIIFYYPNCSGSVKEIEIAKFVEKHNIPHLLVSDTYSPQKMKQLYDNFNLKQRNLYIIPTRSKKTSKTLQKKLNFIRELCPELYTVYRDDLIFTTLLIVSKNDAAKVNPLAGKGFAVKESLMNWIKLQYELSN